MVTIKKIKTIKLINKNKASLFLPFIFSKYHDVNADPIIQYAFSIFILALVVLFCFVNVFSYLLILYGINRFNLKTKYPRAIKYIEYYEKYSLTFIIFEIVVGFTCLIAIIVLNLVLAGILTF